MLVVTIIFGLNIPLSKSLLPVTISPEGLTLSRIFFAAVAFWIASLFVKYEHVPLKDHGFLLVGAFCGVMFNQGLFIIGLNQTSPIDASIIITVGPLFAMIFAALILKEPITLMKVGGVLVGGCGAILLVYSGHNNISAQSSLTGNLMIMTSSMIYAFYLVITKPLTTRYSPITMMKWMFLYGAILLTPLFYHHILESKLIHEPEIKPVLQMIYTLFGATFITYLLLTMAQKRLRPTTISMYNNLQPLIASFAAIVVGMDHFSVVKLLAGMLIFSGVYLVTQSKSKADLEAALVKQRSTN
jgi:drug/metabolite transporter (DMT)-like permease